MNAGNRVLWIVIGLALTAVGVLATLAGVGGVPSGSSCITAADADAWARAFGVTIAAGLVALLGYLLLRGQLRGRGGAGLPDLVATADAPARPAHVASSALSHALTGDLQTDRQVKGAARPPRPAAQHPEAATPPTPTWPGCTSTSMRRCDFHRNQRPATAPPGGLRAHRRRGAPRVR